MAIVLNEPEADACAAALEAEDELLISAGTVAEALIVAARRNVGQEMERLIDGVGLEIVSITPASARRIAQAYETLSDPSLRAAYDAKLKVQPAAAKGRESAASASSINSEQPVPSGSKTARAEAAFQRGLAAFKQNQTDTATSCFAEAAQLAPPVARYRAYYGQALSGQRQTRRVAEAEFQAALALEPDNASYRIMLAELYRSLGMRRRAQGELERALISEPKNKEARAMLATLKQEL